MTDLERCLHEQAACEADAPSGGAKRGWLDWELEARAILAGTGKESLQVADVRMPHAEPGAGLVKPEGGFAWVRTPEIAHGAKIAK